jgi:alpha,alpha-trehalose phosphorylase
MRVGSLDREILWETPAGKQVLIQSRRLVSFQHRHLAAISYQVTVLNAEAPMVISSELIGHRSNQVSEGDPRQSQGFTEQVLVPKAGYSRGPRILLAHTANNSGMSLSCGVDHVIETECPYTFRSECSHNIGQVVYSIDAQPGKPVHLVKFLVYHNSRGASPEELCVRAERTLDRAVKQGIGYLFSSQKKYMDEFWRRSDVQVDGSTDKFRRASDEIQQALRWNLFQILQAAGRAEGSGIPAKGLTGQTYEGHYFWDTEIYVFPFLIYTAPHIARNLLMFRYHMLERARERAKEVNQKGALFPWRTINGEEASAYYAAGTAQYHINADIMFALKKYVEVTGDVALLFNEGAEMLVETARLWLDLGFYSERKGGRFCIDGVTGPDEYNTVVNNNTYTNLMAQENLRYAAYTVTHMRDNHPEHFDTLVDRTGVEFSEVEVWRRAADNMYLPFEKAIGIHPQDDSFLDRKVWDLKNTPKDKFPLLLHFHPLVIYRHQVIKQADVVLAMFLLGHKFSAEEKKLNFEYYDPLTTGDSSLSVCIQSIVAVEIGYLDKAYEYFNYAVSMDLADVGGNVKDGVHIASTGGTWMAAVYGFGGFRDYGGRFSFRPRLPEQWRRLRFPLTIRGQTLEVEITSASTTYTLCQGEGLTIYHDNQELRLTMTAPLILPTSPGVQSKPQLGK